MEKKTALLKNGCPASSTETPLLRGSEIIAGVRTNFL